MLGKLLKKDFRSTYRFFVPLMGGYTIAAAVGKILFEIVLSVLDSAGHTSALSEGIAIFSVFYLIICVIYLVACYLMTSVFVVYDFYKTMVSDDGYLTHTLPVRTSTLICSKTLIAVMWQIVVNLIISLSFLLIFTGHFSQLPVKYFFKYFASSWNMDSFAYGIYSVLNILVESFQRPLLFFACIAIGQQWKNHRILGAILAYIGISIATQIINTIAIIMTGVSSLYQDFTLSGYMLYSLIFGIITTVGFYLVSDYMLSKKLNLE